MQCYPDQNDSCYQCNEGLLIATFTDLSYNIVGCFQGQDSCYQCNEGLLIATFTDLSNYMVGCFQGQAHTKRTLSVHCRNSSSLMSLIKTLTFTGKVMHIALYM